MNIEQLITKIHQHRPLRISLHILFWTIFLFVQQYLAIISFNNFKGWSDLMIFANLLVGNLCIIIFYYPFVYLVLPRYFYKKRIVTGLLLTFLLLVIFAFADVLREEFVLKNCVECMQSLNTNNSGYAPFLMKPMSNRLFAKVLSLGALIGLIFNIALPLSIKYGLMFLRQQYLSLKLGKENLQLEFNFLKTQVNPHFLFNTMNNIYGLILNNEKNKSLETVSGLTQFLRYSLYETNSEQVAVQKELELLNNYINLESIRLNHVKVQFSQDNDGSVLTIPPLLFIPVIENAFKHTSDVPGARILFNFRVNNKVVEFTAENSVGLPMPGTEVGGIGLQNLQRRLSLHYDNKYMYRVDQVEDRYRVFISLRAAPSPH